MKMSFRPGLMLALAAVPGGAKKCLTGGGRGRESGRLGTLMSMRNTTIAFRSGLLALCLAAGAGRVRAQYLEAQIPVGESPQQVFWNPTSNKVYISNEQDGTVTVIDGATNQVRATIAVADYPLLICHNAVLNKVYVSSWDSNRINVIDGVGDTLICKISVSGCPMFMTFSAAMNKLYVACIDNDRIAVIDGATDEVIKSISVRSPLQLLWVPTTNRVLCYTDWNEDTVKAIDCTTDEVVARMPLPTGWDGLGCWCYNRVTDLAYVTARWNVYALTSSGDSVVAVIPKVSSSNSTDLVAVPSLNKLCELDNGWLLAIDGVTNTVTDSLYVGGEEIVCDTVKLKAYCSDSYQNGVHVVDARADTLIKTILFGTSPNAICWNSTNSRVYIADYRDNVIYIVRDTSTAISEPGAPVAVGRYPITTLTRGPFFVLGRGEAGLYSATGRRVAQLHEGWNDISNLPCGMYFVRAAEGKEVRKVVLAR
jgi:YVTN family beta-propeller protein